MVLGKEASCHLFFLMDGLSDALSNTLTGCTIGGIIVNHMMYADDLVIISPSILKGCNAYWIYAPYYGQNHYILFNHDKTVCMFMPSRSIFYLNTPIVFLYGVC